MIKFIKYFNCTIAAVLLLLLTGSIASAQNQSIKSLKVDDGTNSSTYNTNALIDLQSGSKGLLLPRITLTATSSASPLSAFIAGMTIYNTATAGDVTPGYYYSDGTKWIRLADAAAVGTGTGWALTGNAGTLPGTNFIGTTDNQDLIFKRNGTQSGWLSTGNAAFGAGSLPNTATGLYNTAIGFYSLSTTSVAFYNTAVGAYALQKVATTSSNSAFGSYALQQTTGSYNVAIGASAGINLTTGGSNIVIGANQNLASATTGNQLNIGGAIFGTGLSGSVTAPAGNIGIGIVNPQQRLEVGGQVIIDTLISGANTDSIVTVAKGSGAGGLLKAISVTALIGNNAWGLKGNAGTTAGTNFIGTTDNQDLIFKRNNLQSGWINSALQNTSVGVSALPVSTTTGMYNTALGYQALATNTSGYGNSALGQGALQANTTGHDNVGFSASALNSNTSGTNNIAVGSSALRLNQTGSYNIGIGVQSGYSATTGSNNILIGYSAGNSLTTGSNNIVIGNSVNVSNTTASNQMNINNTIFGTGMTGSLSSPAGNIGINIATPTASLEINSPDGKTLKLDALQNGNNTDSVLSWNKADSNVKIISTNRPVFNANQLQGVSVSNATPTSGQSLVYNGASWVPGSSLGGLTAYAAAVFYDDTTGTPVTVGQYITPVSSVNIASIRKIGTGTYRVNLTNPFSDFNYYMSLTSSDAVGVAGDDSWQVANVPVMARSGSTLYSSATSAANNSPVEVPYTSGSYTVIRTRWLDHFYIVTTYGGAYNAAYVSFIAFK